MNSKSLRTKIGEHPGFAYETVKFVYEKCNVTGFAYEFKKFAYEKGARPLIRTQKTSMRSFRMDVF